MTTAATVTTTRSPGNLFRLMTPDAKKRLISNIVSSLGNGVPRRIQELQIQHFYKADPAYGEGVGKGLGLDVKALVEEPVGVGD